MRKRWILWLSVGVAVYLIGVVITVVVSLSRTPDLYSAPAEIRDDPEFESGRLGILKKSRREPSNDWPADIEFAEPEKLRGEGDDFLLFWDGEAELKKGIHTDRWANGLEGDDEIELVAFANWVPQPEDDVSEGAVWEATPVFRNAGTLEVLTAEELDELGVPEAFRKVKPATNYRTPKVRLLFRTGNMKYVRFVDGEGGDQRTEAVVTYDLDSLSDAEPNFDHIGEWARFDMAFLIWHDTPVRFHIQMLTGEPQYAELDQEPGAQVTFEDRLRLQWVGAVAGDVDFKSRSGGFVPASTYPVEESEKLTDRLQAAPDAARAAWISVDKEDERWRPESLIRASSAIYLMNHCGRIDRNDGTVDWEWSNEGDYGQILLATMERPANSDLPVKLLFLPQVAELDFEIAGFPDLPNPRETEDLFDVRIPRLTVAEDPESAEDQLVGFISVAAEVEWDLTNLWDDNPPAELPADRTFRNQSPQELLEWYKKVTPGVRIEYDETAKVLTVNEERENWWEGFKSWVSGIRYYLF